MPADILDDLGYFSEYAKQGGGFYLIKSTDQGRSWSDPSYVRPEPNADGWVGVAQQLRSRHPTRFWYPKGAVGHTGVSLQGG